MFSGHLLEVSETVFFAEGFIRCAKKKKIHVGGCTPGVLYEFRRDCIVPSPPIPLPHGAIYKTLISCDEELMDRRASPSTVDVIYWSMYNEVTSCNSPLQPLSGLRESASAKRDEDKLRTHPFRAASLALALAGALLLFFQTRDRWSHQVMHPI